MYVEKQRSYEKFVCKMLMKLTPAIQFHQHLLFASKFKTGFEAIPVLYFFALKSSRLFFAHNTEIGEKIKNMTNPNLFCWAVLNAIESMN